jgi:TorA maturation chaperone TorD
LGAALGLEFAGELAAYRDALTKLTGPLELLQIYSRVFLAPPRHTQINTGSYLDGSVGGGCVLALEQEYLRHGVARADDFHDLADHVAVQIEFVAWLFLRAAGGAQAGDAAAAGLESHAPRFLYDYPRRWLPPFIDDLAGDLARYELPANPWLHLARMLAVAVAADARAPEIPATELRRARAIDKARRARAARGVTAEDMEFIARRLREKGLATQHLAIAPEARDSAMGLEKRTLPKPRHTRAG